MPHAIWKGSISFGLVQIPVGLYTAEQKKELKFSLLDRKDLAPVGYKRINKKSGDEVPWERIVRGYEYEEGRYVVLSDEDFKRANVEATQTVEIVDFVDVASVPTTFFEKPYYLEPTGKNKKGYALLREALKRTGKAGVATVVIHTRQYLAVVIPQGKLLVLNLLRYAEELKDPEQFQAPEEDLEKLGVTEKELDMAQRLVEGMVDEWKPDRYHDRYREDLLALVNRRIQEGKTEVVEEAPVPARPEGGEVIDLMALLKKSVQQAETVRKERAAG